VLKKLYGRRLQGLRLSSVNAQEKNVKTTRSVFEPLYTADSKCKINVKQVNESYLPIRDKNITAARDWQSKQQRDLFEPVQGNVRCFRHVALWSLFQVPGASITQYRLINVATTAVHSCVTVLLLVELTIANHLSILTDTDLNEPVKD